jgi:hypothetical protein
VAGRSQGEIKQTPNSESFREQALNAQRPTPNDRGAESEANAEYRTSNTEHPTLNGSAMSIQQSTFSNQASVGRGKLPEAR